MRILSLFHEKESRDELGLGGVRDSFSDQFFPGTSTIQTRLRYMLFVPWIYRKQEEQKIPPEKFAAQADRSERELIQPLLESDDQSGVFGRSAGNRIKRLPSSVYWSGLGRWGIRVTPFSQDEYHRRIGEIFRKRETLKRQENRGRERGDDLNAELRKVTLTWHPKLPDPPEDFPQEVDFSLTHEEAEFILDRIRVNCPKSLLSFLALNSEPADVDAPWNHPDLSTFSSAQKELLTHARLFSEAMYGAAIAYNVLLAELRKWEERVDEHRERFVEWAEQIPGQEIKRWSLERLWQLTVDQGHTITYQTRVFIEQWVQYVRQSSDKLLENTHAMELLKRREMKLKGRRSRFVNQRALEQWGGRSGVNRLIYRWPQVSVLLNDLHKGLNGSLSC